MELSNGVLQNGLSSSLRNECLLTPQWVPPRRIMGHPSHPVRNEDGPSTQRASTQCATRRHP
eukprot:4621553-Alexandrium_andersonii.AAC.1